MPIIKLTNGAANWGFNLLSLTNCKLHELFHSGSLSLKLKPAATLPFEQEGETREQYKTRAEAWLESPFSEEGIEVSESERDYMRSLLKKKGEKEELPGNYHVMALALAFDLDK